MSSLGSIVKVGFAISSMFFCAACVSASIATTTPGSANSSLATRSLVRGADLVAATISDVIQDIQPGDVLVLGELHGNPQHHALQAEILQELQRRQGCTVHLGLEFIDWTKQGSIDRFLAGTTTEAEFLNEAGWPNGNSFSDYREQVRVVSRAGGHVFGINAPRLLTSKVARVGLAGLDVHDEKLLPPHLTLGRRSYFERFKEAVTGHAGSSVPDWLQRMFEAQSVWDDTMAWNTLKLKASSCFVILVGDFHVAYGGGLIDRLRSRKTDSSKIRFVSQVDARAWSNQERQKWLSVDPIDGPRADFIVIVDN